ncbi:Asp/Glu racemase [Chromatiales bacterium (ex Bugula neritina AB1)]|nr:Asp/Glu racemase [Chromatiales bacterium (ex Bugula neritina AB1)]
MNNLSRGAARIGVFVPFTNTNLEADMAMMRPNGVSMHFTRIGGYDIDEVPDARQMAGLAQSDMDEAIRLLAGARPDVMLYGCTSATLSLGPSFDSDLSSRIKQKSGACCITAAGALVNALKKLRITNVAFASPYVAALNDDAISFLASQGFNVVSRFDYPVDLGNYGQGELQPDQILEFALRADNPQAEAIVLSCTDLRSAEIIAVLEAQTNKPVITSNQAMLFAAMQTLQFKEAIEGYGRLFELL